MGAESADNRVLHRAGSKNQLTIASCIVQEARNSRQSFLISRLSAQALIWRGKEYFSDGNLVKFLFARCPYTGGLTFPEDTKNLLCSKRAQWNSHATVSSQGKINEQVYGCQVNRKQCPNTSPIDKHIDLVRKYIPCFPVSIRWHDVPEWNLFSSDDFPCRTIVLCHWSYHKHTKQSADTL